MGKRTVFQIQDGDHNLIATLFSNSSHSTQFAEDVFENTLKDKTSRNGPNALIENLIDKRYETNEGNHQSGDRIFWLVPSDEAKNGDRETIIKVTYVGISKELLHKGLTAMQGSAWQVERIECSQGADLIAKPRKKHP